MTSFTAYSVALNLLYLCLALGVVRGALWFFDRSLGINFKRDVLHIIHANSVATALYFGIRLLAVCVLAAAFLHG